MLLDFVKIFFTNVSIIYLLFLIGQFVSPILVLGNSSEGKLSNLFHSVLSGMILVVVVYSVFKTGGITINWLFIIVPGCYFFLFKKGYLLGLYTGFKIQLKPDNLGLLILTLLLVILGAFCFMLPASIENDVLYYSQISEALSIGSSENYYHHYNDVLNVSGVTLYHYFEMWFTALLSEFFSFSTIVLLKFCTYSVLKVLIFLGGLALLEKFYKVRWYHLLFLFSLLFIEWHHILDQFTITASSYSSIWIRPNFMTYLVFFIPVLYSMLRKKYINGLVIILLMIPVSVILIPIAVGVAAFFSICIYLYKRKRMSVNDVRYLKIYPVIGIVGAFVFLFLKYNKITTFDFATAGFIEKSRISFVLENWKPIVGTYSLLIFNQAIIFIPMLIVTFWYRRRYLSEQGASLLFIVVLSVFIVFCGTLCFQLLYDVDNAYQFAYPGYVFLSFSFVFLLIYFLTIFKNEVVRKIGISALTVISLIAANNTYQSKNFIDENNYTSLTQANLVNIHGLSFEEVAVMDSVAPQIENAQGAFMVGSEFLNNYPKKSRQVTTYQPCNYMKYYKCSLAILPMTPSRILYADMSEDEKEVSKAYRSNKEIYFYKNEKEENEYILECIDALNIKFVMTFKIDSVLRMTLEQTGEEIKLSEFKSIWLFD